MANSINILKPSGCFQIQKIIGISTIHGNCRSYQVEWTPSWISGAHLIGCEELIEQFEEDQKEKDVKPDIHGSSVTDEEVVIDNILQKNSASDQLQITKEIEVVACKDTNSSFPPNPVNPLGNVRLKIDSLHSVVQQISERKADRTSMHPDFEGTKMDVESIQDEEVDNKRCFTEEVVIVNRNYKESETVPLKDVQNFHDGDRRKINNHGKYYGRNRIKTTNQTNGNNVKIKLRNLRESSRTRKSSGGDNSLEREDDTTTAFQYNISNSVVSMKHYKLHKPVHQCPTCSKYFAYKQCFQKHQLICIENLQKRESIQNDEAEDPGSKKHLGEKQLPQELKDETELHNDNYQCIICCKTCGSKNKLHLHNTKVHSSCDICEKKFSDMEKLKSHIQTHKTVKTDPLECSYCEKRFLIKSQLALHERVHTGERPYKCGICHKGFKRIENFKRHLKLHERQPT